MKARSIALVVAAAALAAGYGVVRDRQAAATQARVAARMDEATALLEEARRGHQVVLAERQAALRALEAGQKEEGERRWRGALERSEGAERAYRRAAGVLEVTGNPLPSPAP